MIVWSLQRRAPHKGSVRMLPDITTGEGRFTRAHKRAHWDSIVMSARVHVRRAQNTVTDAGPGRGGPMGPAWT